MVVPNEVGSVVHAGVLAAELVAPLAALFAAEVAGRTGVRTGLAHDAVRALATCACARRVAARRRRVRLPRDAVRQTAAADWTVAWHEALVVPVTARTDDSGCGPWSDEPDGLCVLPPEPVLRSWSRCASRPTASTRTTAGRTCCRARTCSACSARRAFAGARRRSRASCRTFPARGATILSPLLVHRSRRARHEGHRRTVHLELAAREPTGATRSRERVR